MRVLYLAPTSPRAPGVTAYTFVDEEVAALRDRGVEIHILSTKAAGDSQSAGIRIHELPPGGSLVERSRTAKFIITHLARLPARQILEDPRLAFHLLRIERVAAEIARAENVDLIHSHFGYPGGIGGLLAARAAGVPLVASFRGMDLLLDPAINAGLRQQPLYDALLRILLKDADRTTYVSDFMRHQGIALGARKDRAVTIPKGVDLERFAPVGDRDALRAELGLQGNVILAVCGLKRLKSVDVILRALALLRDTHSFMFVICGEGEERKALEQLSRELELHDRVRFRGKVPRDAVRKYFACSDLFVLASKMEASGNVLLEAMAAGTPVVCTDAGGPAEYVDDGGAGFVVPVDAVEEMADRIRILLDDPAARRAFGARGRARAERQFSHSGMIDRILAIYHDLTGGQARA